MIFSQRSNGPLQQSFASITHTFAKVLNQEKVQRLRDQSLSDAGVAP